jgi:hypothetical protein
MIDHLSYSSITTFLECGENWRRKYILKEPTKSSPALVFGSAFHGSVEGALTPGNQTPILDLWSANWAKAIEKENVFWGADTPEQHYNEGVRLLSHKTITDAIAGIKVGIDEAGPKIERKVELHVPGVPIPVIGYIDLILDDGTPADLKTSSRSWTEDKASDSLQGLFYLAALNQAGIQTSGKFTHIVFVKTKEPKVQILENIHGSKELFFLFEIIKRIWLSIQFDNFPINPTGWICSDQYCDFYANCKGRYYE